MEFVYAPSSDSTMDDDDLMLQLAIQNQEAIGTLYNRYAPLVFQIASQTLDRAAAEDIVQDVFFTVWHKAYTFDPKRGSFRSWLLQIAHFRILNELRRRNRRPQLDPETDGQLQEDLPDDSSEPIELAWHTFRREALQAAVDKLPPAQRQALSLAFFEDLTHDQVADVLHLPLGTVKTRIRTALRTLRADLTPLGIVMALVGVLAILGIRYQIQQTALARENAALGMLMLSDTKEIHVPGTPGMPPQLHGALRSRPGTPLAVLALHNFTPAPAGKTFQGWVMYNGAWISLGTGQPDASGNGYIIGENPALTASPQAIQITLEPAGGSPAPTGPIMAHWSQ